MWRYISRAYPKQFCCAMRTVVWFSAGVASAVAAKLVIDSNPEDLHLCYIDPGSEHPDNIRFIKDCEKWLGVQVEMLKSDRYQDTWHVWEDRRFLNGPNGALCTTELKKMVRYKYQLPDDIHVFGYTQGEEKRVKRFVKENPGVDIWCPLIENNFSKNDCFEIIKKEGINIPVMYQLGYNNNNCIGCVKGAFGYWNKIRKDFPETFDRMAKLERQIGRSLLRNDPRGKDKTGNPVFLDELDPNRGNYKTETPIQCSLICDTQEKTS
jgi:3'-phosphoadenosine 5'-phosphosulfate sulfotransferase (PAPS reductase)/FAD synthetase